MTIRLSTGLRDAMLGTGSFKATFGNAKLQLFTGAQPASPDNAPTGQLLLTIDNTTGLNFDVPVAGAIQKAAAEIWSASAIANGTAGYYRLSSLAGDTGAQSTTESRIDGSVGTFGADMNMSNPTLVSGATQTVNGFEFIIPAA